MRELCKENKIKQEYEILLYSDDELELLPEFEFEQAYASSYFSPNSYVYSSAIVKKQNGELSAIKNAIQNGVKDVNKLSDIIFFKRHPELAGQTLSASQP